MSNLARALAYIGKLPPAVSGSGGHAATLRAACECVRFGLSEAETWEAMRAYNQRCQPPWSDKDLAHKISSAGKLARPGERVATQPTRAAPARPVTAAELRALTAQHQASRLPKYVEEFLDEVGLRAVAQGGNRYAVISDTKNSGTKK